MFNGFFSRILVVFFLLMLTPQIHSENAVNAAEPERTEKGVKVAQDNYLNIPSDMQVRKVVANVITPEDDAAYVARKIEAQNRRIDEMSSRLQAAEARLSALESKK